MKTQESLSLCCHCIVKWGCGTNTSDQAADVLPNPDLGSGKAGPLAGEGSWEEGPPLGWLEHHEELQRGREKGRPSPRHPAAQPTSFPTGLKTFLEGGRHCWGLILGSLAPSC